MSVTDEPGAEIDGAHLLHVAARAFSALCTPTKVGLAVSGGSDSMAMLHLIAQVAPLKGWLLRAVTVDHGLRPEAADEARLVAKVCQRLGIAHDIMKWDHGSIAGNVMDAARRARYALIAEWARSHGIGHVALAHTATDQAETFLMGLSRKAGLDGLSGMRGHFFQDKVMFDRPFLGQTRAVLRGYLTQHGLAWIDDPTNENAAYTRVKARRALKALAPLGITEERLASTVHHLTMAQNVVRRAAQDAAQTVVREEAGALQIDRTAFSRLGAELERRVLILCLMWLKHNDYPPRASGIGRLSLAIAQGRDATLAGCRVIVGEDQVVIVREPRDLGGGLDFGQLWDGRWSVEGPHSPGLQVRALGVAGLAACKDWRDLGLPRAVLLVTPGIWAGEQLLAAPMAGKAQGWSAKVSQSFNQFILSH